MTRIHGFILTWLIAPKYLAIDVSTDKKIWMPVIEKTLIHNLGNPDGEIDDLFSFTHYIEFKNPAYMKAFKLKMEEPLFGNRIGLASIEALSRELTVTIVNQWDPTMCLVRDTL